MNALQAITHGALLRIASGFAHCLQVAACVGTTVLAMSLICVLVPIKVILKSWG